MKSLTQYISESNQSLIGRFEPRERTAADGKSWWVVFDTKNNKYTTIVELSTKYKSKKDCQNKIDSFIAKASK